MVRRCLSPFALFTCVVATQGGGVAQAADLSANAGVVSDYRFRGLSLSRRRPAVQGGLDLSFADGWSAGTWASSIARNGGSHVEMDLFAGKFGSIAGFDYDITAAAYLYPRGTSTDYVELQAETRRAIGPVTLTLLGAYVPHQANAAAGNVYLSGGAEVALPRTRVTLRLRGGYEDGFYPDKLDWEAGVTIGGERLTGSVSLVGSDYGGDDEAGRLGRTGVQIGLLTHF